MSSTLKDPHENQPLEPEFDAIGQAVGRLARL